MTSAKIYAEGVLQPPTSSRKGGPLLVTSNLGVSALRTQNAYGGLVRRVRNEKVAHKTFVGKIFADHRHLCPARGVNRGRWVYEGSRRLGKQKNQCWVSSPGFQLSEPCKLPRRPERAPVSSHGRAVADLLLAARGRLAPAALAVAVATTDGGPPFAAGPRRCLTTCLLRRGKLCWSL